MCTQENGDEYCMWWKPDPINVDILEGYEEVFLDSLDVMNEIYNG